jgi:hypothetical protein
LIVMMDALFARLRDFDAVPAAASDRSETSVRSNQEARPGYPRACFN